MGMRTVAICLILAACLLIGFGRAMVRGARRMPSPSTPRRRGSLVGWALVMAGVLFMIAGVISW